MLTWESGPMSKIPNYPFKTPFGRHPESTGHLQNPDSASTVEPASLQLKENFSLIENWGAINFRVYLCFPVHFIHGNHCFNWEMTASRFARGSM